MRIAVEGCAHGELEIIYEALREVEKHDGKKIDLLICCGDFQSTRNLTDLSCMAVPDKYKDMCSFYKYYSGEKVAPVLTIFIGGNHEASNYLQELPYGGWVAPNIYYLGYAGVVTVAGVRIAGISGIYKGHDFMQGHWEKAPYTSATVRSVYHIRNLEVFRLKQLSGKIHIFLSHDWPRGITQYGDEQALLRNKPFFRSDIESNSLGSPPCMELLEHHYPSYWFSAHLHCKFAAVVEKTEDEPSRVTKFLALDKCLPKRKFLQILEIPHDENAPIKIAYDLEWLTILYLTNHLLSVKSGTHYMPGQGGNSRWMYTPTDAEKENVLKKFQANLVIPDNFAITASPYNPESSRGVAAEPPRFIINPQTTIFSDKLGIDDPSALLQIITTNASFNNSAAAAAAAADKSADSRNASFEQEIAMSSTLDDDVDDDDDDENDSPDDSSVREGASAICVTPEEETIEKDARSAEDEIDEADDKLVEIAFDSKDDSSDKPENAAVQTAIEPNCKKFKRRNHSLYSDTL